MPLGLTGSELDDVYTSASVVRIGDGATLAEATATLMEVPAEVVGA